MSCQSPGLGTRERRVPWGQHSASLAPRHPPPRAANLYKEDEPNVFAEPAVLARQLLPVLLQLLEKAPAGSPLHASALRWLSATGPSVLRDLRYCERCWSRGTAQGERGGKKTPGTGKLASSSPGPALPGGTPPR